MSPKKVDPHVVLALAVCLLACSRSDTKAMSVASQAASPDFAPLWVAIATYCSPRGVCNVEQLCRTVRDALRSQSQGTGTMQKYWNAQWYSLVWIDSTDQKTQRECLTRRQLRVSLSRSDGKKDWKLHFKEVFEAYLRSTLRGHGVKNRELDRPVDVNRQSEQLPERSCVEALTDEQQAEVLLLERGDATFVQACLDGGVHVEHFTRRAGGSASVKGVQDRDALERSDYKLLHNKKVKNKHRQRGQTQIWSAWVDE